MDTHKPYPVSQNVAAMEKNLSINQSTNTKQGVFSRSGLLLGLLLPCLFVLLLSCKTFYETAETPSDDILGNVRNVIGGMVTLSPGGEPVEGAMIRLSIEYDDRDEPGEYMKSVTRGAMTNANGEYLVELYIPMIYGLTIRVTATLVGNPEGVCFESSQYWKTKEGLFASHSEHVNQAIEMIPWYDRINFEGYECSPPEVAITSPADGAIFRMGEEISFSSSVEDEPAQNRLTYRWTSSRDGDINHEPSFMRILSPGRHTIMLSVDASRSNPNRQETGFASIDITIAPSDRSIADNRGDILLLQGGGGLTTKGGAGGYETGGEGTRSPFKPGFLLGASIPFQRSQMLAIEAGLQVETKGYMETFSYGDDFGNEPGRFKAGDNSMINNVSFTSASSVSSAAADFKNSTSLTYLGIPVMVHATPFPQQPRLGLLAGLQPSFLLGRTSKSSGFGNNSTTKGTDGFKTLDVGLLLGANYRLTNELGIRLVYDYGLIDITENEFDTFKNRSVKLAITYDIPVNFSRVRRLIHR